MLLTEIVVKNLTKPGRYTDDQTKGLHLWVKPDGKRYWIFRFTLDGKRHGQGLGAYPEVGLKRAREAAVEARNSLNKGVNPIQPKKRSEPKESASVPIFRDFALDYVERMRPKWRNAKHGDQWVSTLTTYAFPVIGDLPLDQIDTPHILSILLPIWHTKAETASRLRGRIEQVLTAAIVLKHLPRFNPAEWAGHLEALLPPTPISDKHHAALHYREMSPFIETLRERDCLSALALEFAILNASRTDEVLKARWDEISGDIWTIPGKRMKAGKEHAVPLTPRSLDILAIARSLDPESEFVFSRKGKPMSNMAMLNLVKRLDATITVHGFRSSFRDWASEIGDYSSEVIEKQLAHTIANQTERAYRRGNLLDKRRIMMEHWQAYCEGRASGNTLSLVPSRATLTHSQSSIEESHGYHPAQITATGGV